MEALKQIYSWKERYNPVYSIYHVLKLLSLLIEEGPLGRQLISKMLNIGEGSVRGLIRKMKDLSLVNIDPVAGAYITEKGRDLVNFWRSIVRFSKCYSGVRNELIVWEHISVTCIDYRVGVSVVERNGVLGIRDSVIRYGCDGAIIMLYDSKGVYLLDSSGNPDIDISGSQLGSIITSYASKDKMICISGGSKNSCLDAEKCVWDFIAEIILKINEGQDS